VPQLRLDSGGMEIGAGGYFMVCVAYSLKICLVVFCTTRKETTPWGNRSAGHPRRIPPPGARHLPGEGLHGLLPVRQSVLQPLDRRLLVLQRPLRHHHPVCGPEALRR